MSYRKKVVLKSEEKRLIFGEVYVPYEIDSDGETMAPEDVERMAHEFLSSGKVKKIDVQHNGKESGCVVVESFIARENDPDGFKEGAWVLGVLTTPEVWKAVKSGELNGFSFAGPTEKVSVEAEVLMAVRIFGETEKSEDDGLLPPHSHKLEAEVDENGNIVPTRTSEELDHSHAVLRTTATEVEMGHAHRMIIQLEE